MKRKIGVAALLALVAAGALATGVFAQCGTGVLINFDADAFAYETAYDNATFRSSPGSALEVTGIVATFCPPLAHLDPNDPNKEYTFVLTGLTSLGTTHTPLNPAGVRHSTDYSGGVFYIYEGTPRNAPGAGAMPCPPNPAPFFDGVLILTGTLSDFHVDITQNFTGSYSGSFRSNYQFTGGTEYGPFVGSGTGLLGGLWCGNGSAQGLCTMPACYSAHPDGKWDQPPTAVNSSTWGAIKQLYR